jgi:hypothetical protein
VTFFTPYWLNKVYHVDEVFVNNRAMKIFDIYLTTISSRILNKTERKNDEDISNRSAREVSSHQEPGFYYKKGIAVARAPYPGLCTDEFYWAQRSCSPERDERGESGKLVAIWPQSTAYTLQSAREDAQSQQCLDPG